MGLRSGKLQEDHDGHGMCPLCDVVFIMPPGHDSAGANIGWCPTCGTLITESDDQTLVSIPRRIIRFVKLSADGEMTYVEPSRKNGTAGGVAEPSPN